MSDERCNDGRHRYATRCGGRSSSCSRWRWRSSCGPSGIGILNGTDLVDFDRKVVLSHVHAGTLGWITTSVIRRVALALRRGRQRGRGRGPPAVLTWLTVIVLPVFALTFAFTYDEPRADPRHPRRSPTIVGVFAWVVARARQVDRSPPCTSASSPPSPPRSSAASSACCSPSTIATGRDVLPDGGERRPPGDDGRRLPHPRRHGAGRVGPAGLGDRAGRPARHRAGRRCRSLGGLVLMIGLLLDVDAAAAARHADRAGRRRHLLQAALAADPLGRRGAASARPLRGGVGRRDHRQHRLPQLPGRRQRRRLRPRAGTTRSSPSTTRCSSAS